MTVSSRRERRQQQRRQQQRRESRGSGGAGPRRGISQLWIILGVVAIVTALVLIGRAAGVFDPPVASNIDPNASAYDVAGQTIGEHREDLGNAHVPTGQKVDYPSIPPTSGQHWAQPAAPAPWGVKTSWLQWEVTTHNLEHGGIVLLYASDLSSDDVTLLRGVVRQLNTSGYTKIVLEPWPDMPKDSKVIATAWNWILRLPTLDQTQIIKFTRAHHGGAGEAPESGVG
ncbi:MAG TPA: DUF3105 domain-containing protein [Candidatus Limnocylindrales bacterium]|nr:DUF3105 domain-containing protein [Candidatus Limnocylindrales bacterium]